MTVKQEKSARLILQLILVCSVVTLALWEIRNRVAPQSMRFVAAEAALKAGTPDKARADFDAALKSRPNDPQVFQDIMLTCNRQKCWDLMIEYGTRAIAACKQQPAEVQATFYSALGDAYTQPGSTFSQVQALTMSHHARDLQPHDSRILNQYGYLLADYAVGKGPDVTEALNVLKEALIELHSSSRFTQALLDYTVQLAETEDSYGWALYKDEQYPYAITTLTQALNDYPEGSSPELDELHKVTSYHLGMAFMANGQTDQARNAFKKALFIDPNYNEAKMGLTNLDNADHTSSTSGPRSAMKTSNPTDKKK